MKKLIKRIFLIFCVTIQVFLLCGCSGDPVIVFSEHNPKNGLNRNELSVSFRKEQPIYYAVIAPKGFKCEVVKLSLTKKDTKSEYWGFTNYRNKTVNVQGTNYYSDYFIIREEGIFVMQAFNLKNLNKPIATGTFRVYDN